MVVESILPLLEMSVPVEEVLGTIDAALAEVRNPAPREEVACLLLIDWIFFYFFLWIGI